jgi:hypothetical protein
MLAKKSTNGAVLVQNIASQPPSAQQDEAIQVCSNNITAAMQPPCNGVFQT